VAFLQSSGNKGILGFNLQREIPWTESTVRWTGEALGSAAAPYCRAGARAHRSSPAGATGIRGHGKLDGLLTGAGAVVWRSGDSGEERRWLELIARAKEGAKGLEREGKRCGEVRGWCSPFIGARGTPGRGGRGVTVVLMSLTPLKMARLRGGLRRGLDGGAS
jgi:hypothetical protein